LRVVSPSYTDATLDASDLAAPVREQALRGKQLLLQLKELSQHDPDDVLRPTLAALRLALQALEGGAPTIGQLDDIRTVLDVVTHELNDRHRRQRHQQAMAERAAELARWMRDVEPDPDWSLEPARELAKQLYREYVHHAPPLWWYEATPENPPAWAAAHGLNTAQVLVRMLDPEIASGREMVTAILAGLVHDLGMAQLPGRVLAVREAVTPAVKQQWRLHPTWAVERLAAHLKPEELTLADAVVQHHERLDGSGYPKHLPGGQLTRLGRLLAVADCYAALCQSRPHRPALSPREAVHLLLQEVRLGRLDEAAVSSLLPWGIAPPGTLVELSDETLVRVAGWGGGRSASFAPRPLVTPVDSPAVVMDLDQARGRHLVRVLASHERADAVHLPKAS
jgi:HD-GYP domain-containing protein (c-di-GMP phosphodiesterase class II)